MNCNSCSISDFLKTKLAEQGDNCYTRENLQELGKKYIESGWDNFVDEFLIFINNKNISIINGIRHIEFFRSLQKRRTLTLLYLDANDETIHHRLQKRGDSAINYDHIAEGNLNILKPLANYCLNTNSKSPFLCALELLDFILREEKSNCLI